MEGIPTYEQIPALGLYLDQTQYILEQALRPLTGDGEGCITGTMITNYVKQKVIPPTCKKRYNREQIAQLMVALLLKRVLSAQEICRVLCELEELHDPAKAYDGFFQALEREFRGEPPASDCPPLTRAAVRALVGKLQFERLAAGER